MLPSYPVSPNKSKLAAKMVGTNQSPTVTYNNIDIHLTKKIVDGKPTLCGALNSYNSMAIGGRGDALPVEYTDMDAFKNAVAESVEMRIREMQ
jgi:hypothetical protein